MSKEQKNRDRFHGVPKKADSGYQGIQKYDADAEMPFKKPKNGELTEEQNNYNHRLSKKRIKVENVIRVTKIFNILSGRYRTRRKGHSIKTDIIAGIVNMKPENCNRHQGNKNSSHPTPNFYFFQKFRISSEFIR